MSFVPKNFIQSNAFTLLNYQGWCVFGWNMWIRYLTRMVIKNLYFYFFEKRLNRKITEVSIPGRVVNYIKSFIEIFYSIFTPQLTKPSITVVLLDHILEIQSSQTNLDLIERAIDNALERKNYAIPLENKKFQQSCESTAINTIQLRWKWNSQCFPFDWRYRSTSLCRAAQFEVDGFTNPNEWTASRYTIACAKTLYKLVLFKRQ